MAVCYPHVIEAGLSVHVEQGHCCAGAKKLDRRIRCRWSASKVHVSAYGGLLRDEDPRSDEQPRHAPEDSSEDHGHLTPPLSGSFSASQAADAEIVVRDRAIGPAARERVTLPVICRSTACPSTCQLGKTLGDEGHRRRLRLDLHSKGHGFPLSNAE